MKKYLSVLFALVITFVLASGSFAALTQQQILTKVKTAEADLKDFQADMVISETNKKNISGMGEGYGDILMLKKATISYKKPNKIRWDGYADGVKLKYVQNGYIRLVSGSGIKSKKDVKNSPGKRQDTLDMGFVSSQLWTDNNVTVVSTDSNGIAQLKFTPKFGGESKRADMVWLNTNNLRITKKEQYSGDGTLKTRMVFTDYRNLTSQLPIAISTTLYNKSNQKLGVVKYQNLKVNSGIKDSAFDV